MFISLFVLVAYYLTAQIGFEFVLQPGSVSTLWMPNSIILAGLILSPPRTWWFVVLAALPAHLASELQSGIPAAMVFSWFLSNSIQALIGAAFIHALLKREPELDKLKDLTVFLLCGAFLGPFLSSFLDSGLVKLNGWGNDTYWNLWRLRFLSNVLSTLTVVPFILAWARALQTRVRINPLRCLEAVVLATALFIVSLMVFTAPNYQVELNLSLLYCPLPFLVWATVRFGLRGVSSALLIVMFLAIIGATRDTGPFVNSSSENNALAIQGFLILVSITLIILAVVFEERRLTERALAHINQRHQAILQAVPDVMFLQNEDGVYLDYYTQKPEKLLVTPANFLGKKSNEVLPAELGRKIDEVMGRLRETGKPQVLEYTLLLKERERHFEARLVKAEGNHVLSIVRDVTEAREAIDALQKSEERLIESTFRIRSLAGQLITAQESERRRISILLHDDVGQNVAALGLALSRLKQRIPESDKTSTNDLDELGKQVQDLTAQIRELSHQLHPEIIEHLGLVKALELHVAQFASEEPIAINFAATVRTVQIPPEISVALYRIALEAIRNVSKHSGAKSANVCLFEQDGYLRLEVSDSGHGFDVEQARHGSGLGLLSAEERVRLLQGTLDIRSDRRSGTSLIARVPFPSPS
ncbi:MAG TPA: MASE1 domain-containing protein [Pyrinomonadaceae bacterium]